MPEVLVQPFFDPDSSTFSYVVYSPEQEECAIIDSVLDYDAAAARTDTRSASKIAAFIQAQGLKTEWILETHAHADHLSAAVWLQRQLGGKIAIGQHITQVQACFSRIFGLEHELRTDGTPFDYLFADKEVFYIGRIPVQALHVPGHTPADMAYFVESLGVFVGDTLFQPDVGTARCDFPGGDASTLYDSIQQLLSLPDHTVLYMCHDYPPESREATYHCTVADQKAHNIHVHQGVSKEEFVTMRETRDQGLSMPRLILPAIQINIRAGHEPDPDALGRRYLKLPLNTL